MTKLRNGSGSRHQLPSRAHGWSIEAVRRDSRTVFVVAVPASDIVVETGRASAGLPRGKKGEVA
jgi:hypothetical protein